MKIKNRKRAETEFSVGFLFDSFPFGWIPFRPVSITPNTVLSSVRERMREFQIWKNEVKLSKMKNEIPMKIVNPLARK